MSPRAPDQALRRAVIDLAREAPSDRRFVLDQLQPNQRQRVEGLLADYAGKSDLLRSATLSASTAALSPWLLERVSGPAELQIGITEHAADVLRRLTREVLTEQETEDRHDALDQPSLFQAISSWFARRTDLA